MRRARCSPAARLRAATMRSSGARRLAVLLTLILGARAGAQRVQCPEPLGEEPNAALSKLCQALSKVCVDQGDTYVLYGNAHNPRHPAFAGLPQIALDDAHVDFYGFRDVWGTEFRYPQPLVRPATAGEETKELQEPQFSRWCARRVGRAAPPLSAPPSGAPAPLLPALAASRAPLGNGAVRSCPASQQPSPAGWPPSPPSGRLSPTPIPTPPPSPQQHHPPRRVP
jgi:hypothetical protein